MNKATIIYRASGLQKFRLNGEKLHPMIRYLLTFLSFEKIWSIFFIKSTVRVFSIGYMRGKRRVAHSRWCLRSLNPYHIIASRTKLMERRGIQEVNFASRPEAITSGMTIVTRPDNDWIIVRSGLDLWRSPSENVIDRVPDVIQSHQGWRSSPDLTMIESLSGRVSIYDVLRWRTS
jgi:hypothetical protein